MERVRPLRRQPVVSATGDLYEGIREPTDFAVFTEAYLKKGDAASALKVTRLTAYSYTSLADLVAYAK